MEFLKTILGTLILPPASPLLLAAAGALCLRSRPRLGASLIGCGIAALWLLSLMAVARPLERLAEHYPALDASRVAATRAQAIVILGGGGERRFAPEYGGPAAKPYLMERLAYGAWLARRSGLPVLVTGYRLEAVAMQATLARNFGIDARWVEERAYDTFENARNSAPILRAAGVRRILLVSSAAHLWRAAHEFAAAGLSVVPAPVHAFTPVSAKFLDYLPSPEGLATSNAALHELLGERVREFFAWSGLRRQSAQ
ncbi:MAG TPA: YdcF family protein [Steroidobacteraceae bacterium]|nr:YdcF family protein [Steroidobacteraceae bacterium]